MKEGVELRRIVVRVEVHHLRAGGTTPMLYAGIDYHKRYSQVHVIDERGRTRATARLIARGDYLTIHDGQGAILIFPKQTYGVFERC